MWKRVAFDSSGKGMQKKVEGQTSPKYQGPRDIFRKQNLSKLRKKGKYQL